MTREEAIRIIKIVLVVAENFEIAVQGEELTEEKCKEAVDMAIKALEQEPCDKYKKFAEFVMDEIFDKNWEYNAGGFAEIACRKLEKLGLVKGNDKEWVIVEQEPCDELDFVQPHKKIPVNLELCEDEYIKIPKKALKYRTAGMVAYNVEWLKNHFDIERAVICGAQEPCTDAISRQAAIDAIKGWETVPVKVLELLPSVTPQQKMGQKGAIKNE